MIQYIVSITCIFLSFLSPSTLVSYFSLISFLQIIYIYIYKVIELLFKMILRNEYLFFFFFFSFLSHYFLYKYITFNKNIYFQKTDQVQLSDSCFHRSERGPLSAAVVSRGVWRACGSSPIGARWESGGHAGSRPIEGGSSGRFGRRECQSS